MTIFAQKYGLPEADGLSPLEAIAKFGARYAALDKSSSSDCSDSDSDSVRCILDIKEEVERATLMAAEAIY